MKLHYHTKNGLQFFVRPNSTDVSIIKEVIERDCYGLTQILLREGSVVVDIGGHIGSFSVMAAHLGARVFAFEPMAESFSMLQENATVNGLSIEAFRLGVMDEAGERELHIRQRNFGGSGFFTAGPLIETVKVTTLDDVFIENKIAMCDFLKVDCEDSELLVLSAFHHWDKVKVIAVEYVGAERRDAIVALLREHLFRTSVVGSDEMGIIHAYL